MGSLVMYLVIYRLFLSIVRSFFLYVFVMPCLISYSFFYIYLYSSLVVYVFMYVVRYVFL